MFKCGKKQRVLALVLSLWFYHRVTKNGRQIIVQSFVNTNPESAEMVAVDLISSSTFSKKDGMNRTSVPRSDGSFYVLVTL
jgi:hypothetical protein